MNTQYKIGILVLSVILLGGLLWFFLFRQSGPQELPQKDLDTILQELTSDGAPSNSGFGGTRATAPPENAINLDPLSEEERIKQEIRAATILFIERWGTYSNHTTYETIEQLSELVTVQYAPQIPIYVARLKREHPYQDGYYGMTTKAAAVSIPPVSVQSTSVIVEATARRQEFDNSEEVTREFSEEVTVSLRYIDGQWLIHNIQITKE